jgi:hypothetical protein
MLNFKMASEWFHTATVKTFNTWRYTDASRSVIEIKLSKEKHALFDAEFKDVVLKYKWHVLAHSHILYAVASVRNRTVYMHRLILDLVNSQQIVDHDDGDGLNNVMSNLIVTTQAQNLHNMKMYAPNKSGENAISLDETNNRWRFQWHIDKKRKVKYFSFCSRSQMTKEEAFEAAKCFRDEVYSAIGNRNGVRPK